MPYNKYRVAPKADRTFFGITFASKGEGQYYLALLDRGRRGEISSIRRQIKFILQEGFTYGGQKEPPISFTIDFCFWDKKLNCDVYCEYKGVRTRDYILRRRLFLHQNPQLVFIEYPPKRASKRA